MFTSNATFQCTIHSIRYSNFFPNICANTHTNGVVNTFTLQSVSRSDKRVDYSVGIVRHFFSNVIFFPVQSTSWNWTRNVFECVFKKKKKTMNSQCILWCIDAISFEYMAFDLMMAKPHCNRKFHFCAKSLCVFCWGYVLLLLKLAYAWEAQFCILIYHSNILR